MAVKAGKSRPARRIHPGCETGSGVKKIGVGAIYLLEIFPYPDLIYCCCTVIIVVSCSPLTPSTVLPASALELLELNQSLNQNSVWPR